jgi:hypothetical protein
MWRKPALRTIIVFAASAVFAAAAIKRFHWLGGPYFELLPPTIQDHVWPEPFASRDVILLCREVQPLLPRGATATVIEPSEAPNFDQTHWLTGLGMLPHQRFVPPTFEEPLPDYVLAVRNPFDHQAYELRASLEAGWLYERKR